MATRYWLGRVQPRKMVITITVSGYDVTTTYKVTIGVNVVSVVGSGGTVATVATALTAALVATEYREFQEIAWTSDSAVITGTAITAGTPFTAVSSVSGGAGTIGAVTTTTTNTSPNDINDANNWSAATKPVSTDSVVVEKSSAAMKWGLDAYSAVDIVSWINRSSFTAEIGLPIDNENGYVEYRPTTLLLQTCTTLYEEQPASLGTGGRKYNVGSTACTYTCIGQGGASIGEEVTWFNGTNTGNAIEVDGGSVAIAPLDSDAAGLTTLKMTNGATVRCGLGTTFTTATVTCVDSTLDVRSNIATLTVEGDSQITCWNTMTLTTFNLAAQCTYNSTGTITTLNLLSNATGTGSIDFSQDPSARTITNAVQAYAGTTFNDPDGTVTMSAGIKYVQCRDTDITKDFGRNKTISVA